MHIIFTLCSFFFTANASEFIHLNTGRVLDFSPFKKKIELIIESNCSHCLHQLSILKDCVKNEDIAVFIDNKYKQSEEELRKFFRKKKIPYDVYILDESSRTAYDYKGVSPLLWVSKNKARKSFLGVVSCDSLKPYL